MNMFENIKKIRENKNLTQAELAEKTGLTRVTINRIETGTQKDISASNLNKIKEALNCTWDDLMRD